MSRNGGDPLTYKKINEDDNNTSHEHGFSSSAYNATTNNTQSFSNQSSTSASQNYSSSNMTSNTGSFNDRGQSS